MGILKNKIFIKIISIILGALFFYSLPNLDDITKILALYNLELQQNKNYISSIIYLIDNHKDKINFYLLLVKIVISTISVILLYLFIEIFTYIKNMNDKIEIIKNNFLQSDKKDFKEYITLIQNKINHFNSWNENWNVLINLQKFNNEKLDKYYYKCNISYDYTKHGKINEEIIICYITEKHKCNTKMQDLINRYENYWLIDERNFLTNSDININDLRIHYKVNNIIINQKNIASKPINTENNIIYKIHDENIIEKKENKISYELSFPIEKSDILQINVDIPTKNLKIEFDYSNISNEIIPYGYESLSFADSILLTNENHKLICNYIKWISPKDSYVVAWWQKNENF